MSSRRASVWRALIATVRRFRSLGVRIERILTDYGSRYRSYQFARCCRRLDIEHQPYKPHSPQTTGKAGRFIQTAIGR